MHWRKGVKPVGRLADIFEEIKEKVFKENKVTDWHELREKIGHEP